MEKKYTLSWRSDRRRLQGASFASPGLWRCISFTIPVLQVAEKKSVPPSDGPLDVLLSTPPLAMLERRDMSMLSNEMLRDWTLDGGCCRQVGKRADRGRVKPAEFLGNGLGSLEGTQSRQYTIQRHLSVYRKGPRPHSPATFPD